MTEPKAEADVASDAASASAAATEAHLQADVAVVLNRVHCEVVHQHSTAAAADSASVSVLSVVSCKTFVF